VLPDVVVSELRAPAVLVSVDVLALVDEGELVLVLLEVDAVRSVLESDVSPVLVEGVVLPAVDDGVVDVAPATREDDVSVDDADGVTE
jgi:hypothetical protein